MTDSKRTAQGRACFALLLLGALLACRKSEIKGSLTLDGAEFDVKECRVGQLMLGAQATEPAQRFVLLDDGGGRQLHFGDENRKQLSVYYVAAQGQRPVLIGSDCGTLSMQGDPAQSPDSVRGALEVSCKAGGHTLSGKVDYAHCKAWNMLKPGGR